MPEDQHCETTLPVTVLVTTNDKESSPLRSATLASWLAAIVSPVAGPRAVIGALTHGNDDHRIPLYVNVRALPVANSFGSSG